MAFHFDRSHAVGLVADQMMREPLLAQGVAEAHVPANFTPEMCLGMAAGLRLAHTWLWGSGDHLSDGERDDLASLLELAAHAADRYLSAAPTA